MNPETPSPVPPEFVDPPGGDGRNLHHPCLICAEFIGPDYYSAWYPLATVDETPC